MKWPDPEDLSPKAREAARQFFRAIEDGFTGNLAFDFNEGTPHVSRETSVTRFDGSRRRTLDRGRST